MSDSWNAPVDGTHPTHEGAVPIHPDDALVAVDVQNDFVPGGALGVAEGERVVGVLNRLAPRFAHHVITQDWHPADHVSFAEVPAYVDGSWPVHCVAGTPGAALVDGLDVPPEAIRIRKGTLRDQEAYSGFHGTDLAQRLRDRGVRRLVVGGIATDYCVLNTVLDGLREGFEVLLLLDATRAVADGAGAVASMVEAGAEGVLAEQLTGSGA